MGNARYVGRVGALAVALGVGMAVSTGTGMIPVAAASEDGASSDAPNDTASAGTTAGATAGDGDTGTADSTVGAGTTAGNDTGNSTVNTTAGAPTSAGNGSATNDGTDYGHDGTYGTHAEPVDQNDSATGTTPEPVPPVETTPSGPPTPGTPTSENPAPLIPVAPVPDPVPGASGRNQTPPAGPATTRPSNSVGSASSARSTTTAGASAASVAAPTPTASTTPAPTTTALAAPAAPSAALVAPVTPTGVLTGFVSGLFALVGLGPAAAGAPVAPPAAPPTLWAVLAYVRREIQRTLFNTTPTASATQTGQSVTGVVTGTLGATDADGDPLSYNVIANPTKGTVAVKADGTYTYTPGSALAITGGTDAFTVTVTEANAADHIHGLSGLFADIVRVATLGAVDLPDGSSTTVTVPVTVTPINRTPVAVGDTYTVAEDGTLTVPARGVLTNDTDPNADSLTAVLGSGPTHGTLSLNPNGSFTYTPNTDFAGTDTFTYRASDGTLVSAPATVTITVAAVNDAPVAGSSGPQTVNPATGVVTGTIVFTDVDSTTLTYSVTQPERGTVTVNTATGVYTYTPTQADRLIANTTPGADTVAFTVSASDGEFTTTTTVPITIDPARVVVTGTVSVVNSVNPAGSPIGIAASPDGRTLYVINRNGINSTVSVVDTATNTITATIRVTNGNNPENLAVSPDGRFVYVASNTGTVSIIDTATNQLTDNTIGVNGGPRGIITVITANGTRAYVARQDLDSVAVIDITVGSPTGNTVLRTITVGDAPQSLVASPDGRYVYVANFGGDSVSVIDTTTDTVVATVGAGDGPQGIAISRDGRTIYTANNLVGTVSVIDTASNTAVATIAVGTGARGVRVSPDGSFALVTNTNGGTVTVIDTATNKVIGVPVGVGSGPQNIAWSADGRAFTTNFGDRTLSVLSIVSAGVNAPPVARNNSYTVAEDGTLTVSGRGVLANDVDADADADALTAALVTGPTRGTLTLNPDGSFTYRPNTDFTGADAFTYRASDGSLTSNTATVSITVTPVNDAPVASADTYTVAEDGTLTVPGRGVLANDVDADTDPLNAALVTGPTHGTLTLNPDGSFTYRPNTDFTGTDAFTYRATDGSLVSAPATVTINVTAVNDASVAGSDSYATREDTPLVVAGPGVLANDTDVDSTTLTATVETRPTNGSLQFNTDGSFTYTPRPNFTGVDRFTYTITDGTTVSAPATVIIDVLAVEDVPTTGPTLTLDGTEDTPITRPAGTLLTGATDGDNPVATPAAGLTVVAGTRSSAAGGTVEVAADGSFTYTPRPNFTGVDRFTYTITDGTTVSAPATVIIDVLAVEDVPTTGPTLTLDGTEDTPITRPAGTLLTGATDGDNPVATPAAGLTVVAGTRSSAAGGMVEVGADGSFTYTPRSNFTGTDTFTYQVSDAGGVLSEAATVTISVAAVNDAPVAQLGTPLGHIATGIVTGTLGFTDPNGNAIVGYTVTQPANGTVTVDQTTGVYTYTPVTRPAFGTAAQTTTFTATATDALGATSDPVTVTVTVYPAVQTVGPGTSAQLTYPAQVGMTESGVPYVVTNDRATSRGTITLFDDEGAVARVIHTNFLINDLSWALLEGADQALVATPNGVRVLDAPTGTVGRRIIAAGEDVVQVKYVAATDSLVYSVRVASTTSYRLYASTKEIDLGRMETGTSNIALSPSDDRLYQLDGRNHLIAFDRDNNLTWVKSATVNLDGSFYQSGLAVSDDGSRVFVGTQTGSVLVVDTVSNQVIHTTALNAGDVTHMTISNDGKRLYVTSLAGDGRGPNDSTITVIDTATNAIVSKVLTGAATANSAVTPDDEQLWIFNYDGTLMILDTDRAQRSTTV